jgi:hypothetical protein
VDRLTNEIRRAYRNTWHEDDAELYGREIAVMVEEFGSLRTESALLQAIRTSTFKPTIAQLRDLVPAAPQTCWKPTAEDIRQAEEGRRSPEAQKFRQMLSELKNGKRLDSPPVQRPYIPTRSELAAELASNAHLRPARPAQTTAKGVTKSIKPQEDTIAPY